MASYTGYVSVNIESYEAFRSETIGNAYNVDGSYGAQCWDFASLFYYNAFGLKSYPRTAGSMGLSDDHGAWTCWANETCRSTNTMEGLTQVTSLSDVKRGDLVVLNKTATITTGHIAFADEDYSGSTMMKLLGQNQVLPSELTGSAVASTSMQCSTFLGAWRYSKWNGASPSPAKKKSHSYLWAVFGNEWRDRMWYGS